MKIYNILICLSLTTILVSCAKTNIISPLQFQKQLLAGTGNFQNTEHTWQLDSTKINGVTYALTTAQKNYKKTFTFDGGYKDSDNVTGTWEITTLNVLKQTVIYNTTNKQDSTFYDIASLSSVQLNLTKKLSNGQIISYSFKISN